MRRALAIVVLASGLLLGAAAVAAADSVITVHSDELVFYSEDAAVANNLLVAYDPSSRFRFLDEKDPFGIYFPTPPCSPGKTNSQGNTVEVFCVRGGINQITIDVGPSEDQVNYAVSDRASLVYGNLGADRLTSGNANDYVSGGQGNDTIKTGAGNDTADGGQGADTIETGPGSDNVLSRDGIPESVNCGAGSDTVSADTVDSLAECESVTRQYVPPPPDYAAAFDKTRPRLKVGGSTSQRVSRRRRRVSVAVTANEPVLIQATGFLDAAGINSRLKPASGRIRVAGGGARVRVRLSKRQVRRVLRTLRRGRRAKIRLAITGADPAGNTSKPKRITIRLRRRR